MSCAYAHKADARQLIFYKDEKFVKLNSFKFLYIYHYNGYYRCVENIYNNSQTVASMLRLYI